MQNKFAIKSASQPGKYHLVEVLPDGKLVCSDFVGKRDGKEFVECVAGFYGKPCKHKSTIEKYLNKNAKGKISTQTKSRIPERA